MAFDLNENNVTDYLISEGLLKYSDVVDVETLGWGISNTVVKVTTSDRSIVVKQSLEYLRVREEWKADRTRIYRERECIDILKDVLEVGSLPEIIYEDQTNFLFVMSAAPEESINCARGPIIDEQALYQALKNHSIGGAGLDVMQDSSPLPDHPLFRLNNVQITPHIAFLSQQSVLELETRTAQATVDVLQGRMPEFLVNHDVLGQSRISLDKRA